MSAKHCIGFIQKDDSATALKGLMAYANTHSQIPSM